MPVRPTAAASPDHRLFQSLLPSGLASLVLHGVIAAVTILTARGCQRGLPADAGGEQFRTIGVVNLPAEGTDIQDSPAPAVDPAAEFQPGETEPTPEMVVPEKRPDLTDTGETTEQPNDVPPADDVFDVIGPGTPLSQALASEPPPQVRAPAGSAAGGGSIAPGPGETAFMDIVDHGQRFVYLIDVSGSMQDHHQLALAQRELTASLNLLQSNQLFQVVCYAETALPLILRGVEKKKMYRATVVNVRKAVDAVNSTATRGSTRHLPALKLGMQLAPDVIYFLTDGKEPRLSRSELQDLLSLDSQGTRVNVVEFAAGAPESREPSWLQRLAVSTNGRYRRVDVTARR